MTPHILEEFSTRFACVTASLRRKDFRQNDRTELDRLESLRDHGQHDARDPDEDEEDEEEEEKEKEEDRVDEPPIVREPDRLPAVRNRTNDRAAG
jgi:hypothetical protein